jgi:hypothetical protein
LGVTGAGNWNLNWNFRRGPWRNAKAGWGHWVWRLLLLYLCPRERQREQWDARNLGHAYTPQLGQPKEPGVVLALSTALGVPNLPDFPNLSAALGVCGLSLIHI